MAKSSVVSRSHDLMKSQNPCFASKGTYHMSEWQRRQEWIQPTSSMPSHWAKTSSACTHELTVRWYPNRYVVLFYHVVFYFFLHVLCAAHHNRLHSHNAIVFLYVCILFPPFFRLWRPTNSVNEAATTMTTWMTTTMATTQASPPPPNSITLPCKSLPPPSLLPLTSHTHHYHI